MKSSGHKYSPARRIARAAVWLAFGVVLCIRHFVNPEPLQSPWFGRQDRFEEQRWNRRPPTVLRSPVAPIPADLPRLEIEITPKDAQILRGYRWDRQGHGLDRPQVLATVREGNKTYPKVALHLKGSAGSFRPFDDKPALTLNFSKNAPGQRFHGYSKLSLNNSAQDSSYISEALSRELFNAAGVPVPRAEHATVVLNGRDLGLYVMVEGYNKDFLRRHFKNVKGNLYDGGFCQDLHPGLNLNSGDFPTDHSQLEQLITAVNQAPSPEQWTRLNQLLDMDRFIKMLAMEVLTCHWDGYSINRNNYRLFHNRATDQFVFMPHGLDQMFGSRRASPEMSIFLGMHSLRGSVSSAVISLPQGRDQYLAQVGALYTNLLNPTALTNRVHQIAQRIRPTLAAYGAAEDLDANVNELCSRILQRAQSVAEQLAIPRDLLAMQPGDAVPLSRHWTPRPPPDAASANPPADDNSPQLQALTDDEGRDVLFVDTRHRTLTASWRTKSLLNEGVYVFEGRARTFGATETGGACLRVSGAAGGIRPIHNSDWTPLRIRFVLREPTEVEFICEARQIRGKVWFDLDSLTLARE